MSEPLKLMAILAHPDDESLAVGATLAKYAALGVETYLLTATKGERGWFGLPDENPGPTALGHLRAQELQAAAQVLGLKEVVYLGYCDGDVDQAASREVVSCIMAHIRRVRPQVVITFDPAGIYGHPDHIAISQFATAAIMAAASPHQAGLDAPHQVAKLYYRVELEEKILAYQRAFGELVMCIDGMERRASSWERWSITTEIDTTEYWQQTWQAIQHHRSQLPGYHTLQLLPETQHRYLWSTQHYYRVFSQVNSGRALERDLFAGIQHAASITQGG